MLDLFLDIGNDLTGISLVPAPVQVLGGEAQLDDQIAREVLRLDFPAFFPPQPEERSFIIAHDDPGIRAADEVAAAFFGVREII